MTVTLDDLRMMLTIRGFEETISDLFTQGLVHGTTHLCIGQEAVPTAVSALLTAKDLTLSNHRGHGHFLARGADPMKLFAELLGRVDGYCRGKGGTQHLSCVELGHLGSNGITAGSLPVACGAALSQKRLGTGAIVVPYFGDGAVGEGAWHEAMNMAAVWKLPVLFVCENNFYAMSTPVSQGISGRSIAGRAATYDMPWRVADGNDVAVVRQAASELIAYIRDGKGPAFLEAQTYRQQGHSKSDKREYRTTEEEQEWAKRDPIVLATTQLIAQGVEASTIEQLRAEVSSSMVTALEQAKKSPWPAVSEALKDLYA